MAVLGMDTSKWQSSKVDYYKAKQAGVGFVFLRIGCGTTKDKCFEADYASAKAAGLKVGVYYYTYSKTDPESIADATRVLGWLNNRHLDFPVAYDVEDAKQKGTARKSANSSMYNAFKKKIEAGGIYDAILYTGENFYNSYFDKSKIDDDLWIAKYSTKKPSVGRDVAIWQFTSDKIVASYYVGKLDRNYLYIDNFQGSRTPTDKVSNNPYPVPARLLKKTLPGVPLMKGNDVKWLQWELDEKGYLTYKDIDGIFGKDTREAVIAYQKDHGLKQDGIVGSATRYSMLND